MFIQKDFWIFVVKIQKQTEYICVIISMFSTNIGLFCPNKILKGSKYICLYDAVYIKKVIVLSCKYKNEHSKIIASILRKSNDIVKVSSSIYILM